MRVHRGFYVGAVRHLDEIVAAVRARAAAAGRRLPVWVAGHSLGGGCAGGQQAERCCWEALRRCVMQSGLPAAARAPWLTPGGRLATS